jgi:hypothetical protein
MKIIKYLSISAALLFAAGGVQAGHLFTQATTNSPIFLAAGTGVTVPQLTTEGSSTSSRGISIDLASWSAGDALRLIIGSYSQLFSFDSPLTGTTQASTYLNNFNLASLPGIGSTGFAAPDSWRIESVSGNGFTFTGYRIYTDANGVLDGTGAGLLNQTVVTSNSVPEPTAFMLMVVGLLGFAITRRKVKVRALRA